MSYLSDLYNRLNQEMIMLVIMILLLMPLILLIKKTIFPIINYYIAKHHSDYEEILNKYSIYQYSLHSLLSVYFIFWSYLFHTTISTTYWLIVKDIVIITYTSSAITMLLLTLVNMASDIYQNKIKISSTLTLIILYHQMSKIFIVVISIIITVSKLLNISLVTFLTSLGATTAFLTFIFKDTILGLIASLQLIFQDIIRIGDWISVTQYHIEGTVEKITITLIHIKNSDHTISTIPTYSLLTTNVTNWRRVNESGAKQIKRALYIDMTTIKFCSISILEELKKLPYIANITIDKVHFSELGTYVTNIKVFRLYVQEYLKNNPLIYQQNFTFLVRQLEPTSNGLPIELCFFTKAIRFIEYANIQTEIFEHLLAILPKFKLKIFQHHNGISEKIL